MSNASAVSRSRARRMPGPLADRLLESLVLLLTILLFATPAKSAGPGIATIQGPDPDAADGLWVATGVERSIRNSTQDD